MQARKQPSVAQTQRAVLAEFQVRGLPLKPDAAAAIAQFMNGLNVPPRRFSLMLACIADRCSEATATQADGVVDVNIAKSVIDNLTDDSSTNLEPYRMVVIPSLDTPRLVYDPLQKSYHTEIPRDYAQEQGQGKFVAHFGTAEDKVLLFKRRYDLVKQRLLRDTNFGESTESSIYSSMVTTGTSDSYSNTRDSNGDEDDEIDGDDGDGDRMTDTGRSSARSPADTVIHRLNLTTVEALTGSSGNHCVLGFLSQTATGWALEDPSSSVPVKLADPRKTDGFFTECGLVLAIGTMVDGTFVIDTIGQPVPEQRGKTLRAIGPRVDYFGLAPPPAIRAKLRRCESEDIIILSDVFLDNDRTFSLLERLFTETSPQHFVFLGNFVSRPLAGTSAGSGVIPLYDRLAQLIGHFPKLQKTHFLFVPGPNDPCGSVSGPLPHPRLPELFTAPLVARLGTRVHFGENPCRVRFGAKEIVFFRFDALSKMQRHCVFMPDDTDSATLARHLARTICGQGHLCPLPLSVSPVYWNLDHCLTLCPLPHVVVVADRVSAYGIEYTQCKLVNPGSFARGNSFIRFSTGTNSAEICSIDNGNVPEQQQQTNISPTTDSVHD